MTKISVSILDLIELVFLLPKDAVLLSCKNLLRAWGYWDVVFFALSSPHGKVALAWVGLSYVSCTLCGLLVNNSCFVLFLSFLVASVWNVIIVLQERIQARVAMLIYHHRFASKKIPTIISWGRGCRSLPLCTYGLFSDWLQSLMLREKAICVSNRELRSDSIIEPNCRDASLLPLDRLNLAFASPLHGQDSWF